MLYTKEKQVIKSLVKPACSPVHDTSFSSNKEKLDGNGNTWDQKHNLNDIYEDHCVHGVDCKQINSCRCTDLKESARLDKIREEEARKNRRNSRQNKIVSSSNWSKVADPLSMKEFD